VSLQGLYNLLVTGAADAWGHGTSVLDASRFLEHTGNDLKKRFKLLDERAIANLKALPTLFAYETPVGTNARVGWITEILPVQRETRIAFRFDDSTPPVAPERILDLRWHLQIDEWEMNRTHWAVKQARLLEVLRKGTALAAAARAARGEYMFSRQTILKACDIVGSLLSHSELDRFVLELGVEGLSAGRDRGTKVQRTMAIAQHTLGHPEARTAAGEPLGLAVVRRAAQADPDYPAERYGIEESTRSAFWRGLKQDGYAFVGAAIVADVEGDGPAAPPYAAIVAPHLVVKEPATSAIAAREREPKSAAKPKIFIVHGRDNSAKYEVANFLRQLELEPIILHERPNGGRTLISKFQEESSDIHFAVVLMTPDDVGSLAGSTTTNPRARQNVIFELGFFIGQLGAPKVCALVAGGVERPSDFEAVVYVEFGPTTAWKIELARELRHAGIAFDANKVF
jgi:predicted nucleotide-binding protein